MSVGLLRLLHPDPSRRAGLVSGESNAGSVCQRPAVTDGQLPNGRPAAEPFSSLLHNCNGVSPSQDFMLTPHHFLSTSQNIVL